MRKFLQKKLKEQKGMTLIELLAVIVIIAIIAAIAIPAIGNIIDNSRVGAIKSDALSAINAANLYYADNPEETDPVLISALEDDYLDDLGSLALGEDTDQVTNEGLITASGTVGDVTVEFNSASKADVNGLSNNTEVTDASAEVTAQVTSR